MATFNPYQAKPQQPTATEFNQWNQGRSNARSAYDQTVAQQNYARSQAQLNYNQGLAQQQYQNHIQRQGFDDPYVGRGLLNSGIRSTGLTNMYTQQQQGLTGLENTYASAMGQANLSQNNALTARNQALRNYDMQEQARRADLAAQIKGIV